MSKAQELRNKVVMMHINAVQNRIDDMVAKGHLEFSFKSEFELADEAILYFQSEGFEIDPLDLEIQMGFQDEDTELGFYDENNNDSDSYSDVLNFDGDKYHYFISLRG